MRVPQEMDSIRPRSDDCIDDPVDGSTNGVTHGFHRFLSAHGRNAKARARDAPGNNERGVHFAAGGGQ